MKTVSTKKVRSVLWHTFNLRPLSRGNGTGHEIWADPQGRTCKPVLRKKDISLATLFCLGRELEAKGICGHRALMRAVLS